jgi:hypothetical protein
MILLIIIWFVLALIIGSIGKNKKIGFAGAFFLSLLLSPLIGLIIALASSKKAVTPIKKIRCDGCRELIEGSFIVIRPKGTQDKYDYCGKKCRDQFHPKYMKEKGIDWSPPSNIEISSENEPLDK